MHATANTSTSLNHIKARIQIEDTPKIKKHVYADVAHGRD
jgi:hypothetical protein